MKKYLALAAAITFSGLFIACGKVKESNKSHDNIIVKPREKVEADTAVHKMNEIDVTIDTIKWMGSTYKARVHRYTNDSLSVATDETGKKYRNNLIKMVITRKDGSVFFEKVFNKTLFENFLDEDYLKQNVLLGLVFNGTDSDNLHFLGSVGRPDILTEEFVPFNVYITKMGDVKVEKATLENLEGYKVFEEEEVNDSDQESGV